MTDDLADYAEDTMTQEELQELQQYLRQQAPLPEEKVGVPQLLTRILKTRDTRKAGSVGEEDLEKMRIYLKGSKFFTMLGANEVARYLLDDSEVLSSTSLSHKGEFLKAIITSKRDISLDRGKSRKKSFFSRKEEQE